MAKTYINSVKYMVKIKFEVDGVVDKPDIIGAIFGQSEGLLGDEMDLKELQKNGKIGRIEIKHESVLGKTAGKIFLPSNMDMVQTSILAAAIESVDKVGPYEAKFEITSLEDARKEKRAEIKSRAQELLERFKKSVEPDTNEITESIREGARTAKLESFGPEKLPAGPEVKTSNEIIVVEGRADVINLLKNQIKNAVAMQGSTIPTSVLRLARTKSITVFVDGDRGGELIAKNFLLSAKAKFVARAPDGKEVEELTRKEIIQSLRKQVPAQDFLEQLKRGARDTKRFEARTKSGFRDRRRIPRSSFGARPRIQGRGSPRFGGPRRPRIQRAGARMPMQAQPKVDLEHLPTKEEQEKFLPIIKELKGKSSAKLFDDKMKEVGAVEVKKLVEEIGKKKGVNTVVFDGIVTKRLVEAADKAGVKFVVGVRKGKTGQANARVLTFSS